MTLTEELSAIVGSAFVDEGLDARFGDVKVSDRPDLAQFQCNGALAAAKMEKKNPRALGELVAARLKEHAIFQDVSLAGPGFLNLTLTDDALATRLNALVKDARLGGWTAPVKENVVIDYGGPNVAKPLHVGHLRAAIIGEALKRLFRFVGHDVTGDVHLGDWGLQMGQLLSELEIRQPDLVYFDADLNGPYPSDAPITLADLEEMYPAASAACKEDKARLELAKKATRALQDGRPGYRALWRHFVDLSVAAMKVNYADLNVEFDLWKGEADADPLIAELTADLKERGILEESDGAHIIRVACDDDKQEIPPVIFVNSEGAVGYHATDIATIVDRRRDLNAERILYVVDNRQSLHFVQVFRSAALAGYAQENQLEHLPFGTMQGPDRKPFKTREGGVLKLRDMIDQVTAKATERLLEARSDKPKDIDESEGENDREGRDDGEPDLEIIDRDPNDAADIARQVGVAALKFADLSNPRTTDYVFDLDRFMTFEGKTGPYLLYANVRVKSLIEKAARAGVNSNEGADAPIVISENEERDLALALLNFGDATKLATEKRMPHFLCDHAFAIAQGFSKFYAACRIVDEGDDTLRASRLSLAAVTGRQLEATLNILGIETPERM